MWKNLIDIDVRKVTAVISVFVTIAVVLSSNPGMLSGAVPESWIPHVAAVAKIVAALGSALTGSHNIAALISPRVGDGHDGGPK